jgi:alpha-1,3-rhamnosyltransferase
MPHNQPNIKEPLISVIIPSYNHEKYVLNTIESVIAQTYQNIELLIIDDASTDKTYERIVSITNKIKSRFNHYKIIRSDRNIGTAQSLNHIVQYANGEYIYIIASDDVAYTHAIETLYNFLNMNIGYALAVGNNALIDNSNKIIYWDKKRNSTSVKNRAAYLTFCDLLQKCHPHVNFLSEEFGSYKSLLSGNYVPNGYLIRHDALKRVNYWCAPKNILEDYLLVLKLSKHYKLKYIDQPLLKYRWHSHNTIKSSRKIIALTISTLKCEKKYAKETKCLLIYYKYMIHLYFTYMIVILRNYIHNIFSLPWL